MAGRPKSRARQAAKSRWGSANVYSPRKPRESASRSTPAPSTERLHCPASHTLYTVLGRTVCVDRNVQHWLATGNGRGGDLTRNGTPSKAKADLEQAVREHVALEQKRSKGLEYGFDSKFETRSTLVDDPRQGLWLWLTTSAGRGIYPKGVIAVVIDGG